MTSSYMLIQLFASLALSLLFCFATWGVFTSRFLIQKIFILIVVFNVLAYYLLVSGIEFISLIILLLYVGAIAVLFLFVVMILNPDHQMVLETKRQLSLSLLNSTPINEVNLNVLKDNLYFSPIFLGLFMGGATFTQYFYINNLHHTAFMSNLNNLRAIYNQLGTNYLENNDFVISVWQNYFQPIIYQNFEVINIATLLYTRYGLGVLLVGLMLLNAMVGAILLTLRNSGMLKRQSIDQQSRRYSN